MKIAFKFLVPYLIWKFLVPKKNFVNADLSTKIDANKFFSGEIFANQYPFHQELATFHRHFTGWLH